MNEYIIYKCVEKPDWDKIPELVVSTNLWLPASGITMKQQLCYNSQAIYVRQTTNEKKIRAEHRGTLCQVCEDSCMEFFFMPDGDSRYINFEINPNGSIYLGIGRGREDRVRLIPKMSEKLFNIRTSVTNGGWEAIYEIPIAFLELFYSPNLFASGKAIRANCYKCGDLTENKHYISWNEVTSQTPDFHRPEDFGVMKFC